MIAVHLKGHFCCSQPFARYIRETNRQGCRIINFSSVSGLFGNIGQSNYGAAKAGIAGFSRVLALSSPSTAAPSTPQARPRMTIPRWKAAAKGRRRPAGRPAADRAGGDLAGVAPAQELTAQILHVSRGQVAIMQQPALIRAFKTSHLWTQDDLDRVIPALWDAKKAHDARAKKEAEPEALS